MNRLRQSFSWWCFENRGVPATRLLKEAKTIGYHGVASRNCCAVHSSVGYFVTPVCTILRVFNSITIAGTTSHLLL